MAKTALVYVLPAALIALAWLRLEEPRAAGGDWLWIVLLALAPALARPLTLRLALTVPAALAASWIALDRRGLDDRRGFFEPVGDRFADGVTSGTETVDGFQTVYVEVRTTLPVIGLLGPTRGLTVRGHALEENQ